MSEVTCSLCPYLHSACKYPPEKMSNARRVLVLGGRGFIGRHAVDALRARGADVTIGTRRALAPNELEISLHQEGVWAEKIKPFDVVLNCVGILRQRYRESYRQVHQLAPGAIAAACSASDIRFVHVSALGLTADAKSRFITSKLEGENSIRSVGGDWAIARLSLIDGDGGYGAAWLRGVAKLPFFFAPTSARGQIAALTAEDAGHALATLCLAGPDSALFSSSRFFELGGEETHSFADYIRGLRSRYTEQPARCIRVPGLLARCFAHLCDVLHFSPFSFGHWELLCRYNVPKPNRLSELLGHAPERVIEPNNGLGR